MKKFISIAAVTITSSLTGCASLAPLLPMPTIPAAQTELVEATLDFKTKSKLEDNFVQLKSHKIKPNSSIVINVPDSLFNNESVNNSPTQDFKTKDFFNDAEQQIEKVFITDGFRVLSRSKFEAKLRTLRDESHCNLSQYPCLYSQVAPEVRPILDDLKAKLDRKAIDASEYADEIKKFKDKLQTASTGKKRADGEKELTDISEVIRAAESGDVQANYILQINKFDTDQKSKIKADLNHDPKIRDFIRNNPGIKAEFDLAANHEIVCAVVGATLNAKLVDVKTGEIVWIGNHQLNEFSSGIHKISVEMGSRKYVTNEKLIEQFINDNNTEQARKDRSGKEVSIPAFAYKTDFIKPTVASGRCEQTSSISNDDKSDMVRQVAKELISTIKVEM